LVSNNIEQLIPNTLLIKDEYVFSRDFAFIVDFKLKISLTYIHNNGRQRLLKNKEQKKIVKTLLIF